MHEAILDLTVNGQFRTFCLFAGKFFIQCPHNLAMLDRGIILQAKTNCQQQLKMSVEVDC